MEIEYRCLKCRTVFDGHPLNELRKTCPACKSEDAKMIHTDEYWDQVQRWGEGGPWGEDDND